MATLPQSSAAVANMDSYTHVPPGESLAPKDKNKANDQMETGWKMRQRQKVTCDTAVYEKSNIFVMV